MGYALAAEAAAAGAQVTLISGPVALAVPERVQAVHVITALEMLSACLACVDTHDVFIGVAAVADYRPAEAVSHKIKKAAETMQLSLVRNPDIIGTLAGRTPRPMMVGFAAETDNVTGYGADKLTRKGLDLMFANEATSTFGSDYACATALWQGTEHGQILSHVMGPAGKNLVARQMLGLIQARWLAAKQ
jgi:phosphopantothenoylcysteine decarboxylase/phosphopantothenate--cysteine ligase